MSERLTKQKQIIYNAIEHNYNHPTADDIYLLVSSKIPSISLKTIYRNLNSLAESGIIKRIPVPNESDRFDPTIKDHYHLLCTKCHKFVDVNVKYEMSADKIVAMQTNYKLIGHNTIFYGICPDCQKEN